MENKEAYKEPIIKELQESITSYLVVKSNDQKTFSGIDSTKESLTNYDSIVGLSFLLIIIFSLAVISFLSTKVHAGSQNFYLTSYYSMSDFDYNRVFFWVTTGVAYFSLIIILIFAISKRLKLNFVIFSFFILSISFLVNFITTLSIKSKFIIDWELKKNSTPIVISVSNLFPALIFIGLMFFAIYLIKYLHTNFRKTD
ncbi:hypothetical protein RJI07_05990 [Mycoplasmatota bacterium WC30]